MTAHFVSYFLARMTTHAEPISCLRDDRIDALEKWLLSEHGPTVRGSNLAKLLGYANGDAFRHAVSRGVLPVNTFFESGKRGRCALTKDIATWIVQTEERLAPVAL